MPIESFISDPEALTMTLKANFSAPRSRVWEAYADPRQVEKFWGPKEFPATFTRHDFVPGGFSNYVMTGPGGEQHHGYWEWLKVTPETSFELLDGFADATGKPNNELPAMRMVFEFAETESGTSLTTTSYFTSAEALETVIAMGVEEGTRSAMSQIDAVLADLKTFAADIPAHLQLLSATQVRVSRVLNGTPAQVWRAHYEPTLLKKWLLGPDGWTMPVCEMSEEVGSSYRYEWEQADGGGRFGFEGELLEANPPHRAVNTERMIGMPGEGTVNELTLTPVPNGTLLSLVITYPSKELRDTILATGMVDGMETSYQRLQSTVLES